MEEPKPSFKWKEKFGKTQKDKKSKSIKRMQKAWEWGKNEYICPYSVTILWCLSYKKPNAEVNEPNILASEELSGLWKHGYPTQVDHNQC